MNNLHPLRTSPMTRIVATLAVSLGLILGGIWSYHTVQVRDVLPKTSIAGAIDPSIPVVIVVGKRLSPAEKREFAVDDRNGTSQQMMTVSGSSGRRSGMDGGL